MFTLIRHDDGQDTVLDTFDSIESLIRNLQAWFDRRPRLHMVYQDEYETVWNCVGDASDPTDYYLIKPVAVFETVAS